MIVALYGLCVHTEANDVVQLSYCSARVNGALIDLRSLTSLTAQIVDNSQVWNYTFNPCDEFSLPENRVEGFGDKCLAVALCKAVLTNKRQFYYTLGYHSSSHFVVNHSLDNQTYVKIVYHGYGSMKGKTTNLKLVCDKQRVRPNEAVFKVIKDLKALGEVHAELHHICCCPDGCLSKQIGNQGTSFHREDSTSNDTFKKYLNGSFEYEVSQGNLTNRSDVITFEEQDIQMETDRTKVLIIVGVNVGVIMIAGLVGLTCYNKRTHISEIYHKVPVTHIIQEPSVWQLTNSIDLEQGQRSKGPIKSKGNLNVFVPMSSYSAYRDGAPQQKRKSLCFPVLEHCTIPKEMITLGQRLGGGIFGDTYVGDWTGITVAVKRVTLSVHQSQISVQNIQGLQNQVSFLSKQRHRSIVSVLGCCTDSKHPYIIAEFIHGQVVKDFIKRGHSQLTWLYRVKILSQVADGMAFLHSTSPPILHRDLRCANMFLANNDIVKICDFGIVNIIQPLREGCKTEDCCCQGQYSACPPSISWTAPEVLKHPNSNEKDGFITTASDVFSFAVVMWELVLCEDPYEDMNTAQEVMEYVLDGGRPEISTYSNMLPSYLKLMKKCWSTDVADRPSFKQVTVLLNEVLHHAKAFQKTISQIEPHERTNSKSCSSSDRTSNSESNSKFENTSKLENTSRMENTSKLKNSSKLENNLKLKNMSKMEITMKSALCLDDAPKIIS